MDSITRIAGEFVPCRVKTGGSTPALSAKFNTLGSERYQMIDNLRQIVKDMAASVPYDVIYVLTNTDKYGGGGIYNFYGISSAQQTSSTGKVYIRGFGASILPD